MTVEITVVGASRFTWVCDADWADELAPWRVDGEADAAPLVDAVARQARSHASMPSLLSPEIAHPLLAGLVGDGLRIAATTGRDVLSRERFRDGVARNHARYVASILAGLMLAALPAWEQIHGYPREGFVDALNTLRRRWRELRASGTPAVFGSYLAGRLVEQVLERFRRPMKPLWSLEPALVANDFGIADAVHIVCALPDVLDVDDDDDLAFGLRTMLRSLALAGSLR